MALAGFLNSLGIWPTCPLIRSRLWLHLRSIWRSTIEVYRELYLFPVPATVETSISTWEWIKMHHRVPHYGAMVDIYQYHRYPGRMAPPGPPKLSSRGGFTSNPVKTPHVLMLFSWSCGGQECPDGVPGGYNWTANCLMSILSFYRPKKACKTPKIWCQDHTCPYATSDGAVEDMYDLIDSCKWAYNLSSDILWANNIISSHFQAISRHFQKPHLIPLFCIIVTCNNTYLLTLNCKMPKLSSSAKFDLDERILF